MASPLIDFNVVMGSPAELRERQQHIALLHSMTPEQAQSSIMLLNVCHAAGRNRAGTEELPFKLGARSAVANLPWYTPYAFSRNEMDQLRAVARTEEKVFGLFVASTERLQYGEATVLDDDGGEWTLISHSSLRLRPGKFYDTGLHPHASGVKPSFSAPLWTLYAILEILWLRLALVYEAKAPLDELTPHSETNIFELSLLTRAFLELVAFTKSSGLPIFAAEVDPLTVHGFSITISDDRATAQVVPREGMQHDHFTAWFCTFLNKQIERVESANVNTRFDSETVTELVESSTDISPAERMRRLLVVYQSSGDDDIWRAVQAVVIATYHQSEHGLKLAQAVRNELPSSGRCFFLAVMDEFEEELQTVLPDFDVAHAVVDCGERSSTGIMHMANYRYESLTAHIRLSNISFGPGRGIELSMPQEPSQRVKIKDEKFRLRISDDGLIVEEDNLFAKIIRVLNSLPEMTVLSSGIGKPDVKRPEVSRTWLVNLILAGKAGADKAVWVLRMIYNGLLDVDAASSRASYIPSAFKKEGVGIRLESHLDWRVAQKLCYITDGKQAFLVKDHESRLGMSLKRRSPSTISCRETTLNHSDSKTSRTFNGIALLSRCKLA